MSNKQRDSDRKKQAKGILDSSGDLISNPLKMVKTPDPQPKEIVHMNILGESLGHKDDNSITKDK